MKTIRELITGRSVLTLLASATALEAARAMSTQSVGCVMVIDGEGRPAGIFTERDLMTRITVHGKDPGRVRLEEVMTTDLYLVEHESKIQDVRKQMRERHIRHLPVCQEGKLVAVLSLRDILRADLEEHEHDLEAMTAYIQGENESALSQDTDPGA